jgi:hypothetical protein
MTMGNAYVSIEEFKKLEAKINRILDAHALDDKLTRRELELVNEAKKDIKKNKSNFTSADGL